MQKIKSLNCYLHTLIIRHLNLPEIFKSIKIFPYIWKDKIKTF